jgi:hypothetical protein
MQCLGTRQRDTGVDVRLLQVLPRRTERSSDQRVIADLDYLVTVQLSDPAAEQRAATELLLAAMGRHEIDVVVDRNIPEICASLSVPPAPGFVLRTPLVRSHDAKVAPRVRAPLIMQTSGLGIITGRVLGPADIPIAGATVTAVDVDRFVRTDRNGTFRIAATPDSTSVRLVVRARGVESEATASAGQPVVLRLPLEE